MLISQAVNECNCENANMPHKLQGQAGQNPQMPKPKMESHTSTDQPCAHPWDSKQVVVQGAPAVRE